MLESLKKIFEGIFSKVIYYLSKYLLFIALTGLTWIAAHIYAANVKCLVPYAIIFSVSIAAGIGFLGLFIYTLQPFIQDICKN